MNSSSPFLPPGSEMERQNQVRSQLKVKIFAAIGVNVAVLLALLLTPGCKREQPQPEESYQPIFTETNPPDLYASEPTNGTPAVTDPAAIYPPPTDPVTDPTIQTQPPVTVSPPVVVTPPGAATEYTIKAGDTFSSIAPKHNVTVKALLEANPNVDPAKLQIGKTILIPPPTVSTTPTASGTPTVDPASGETIHTVKSDDTLSGLATKYKTTIKAIQTANGLADTRIKVGDKLKIPAGAR
jgi:LysM repeat protein